MRCATCYIRVYRRGRPEKFIRLSLDSATNAKEIYNISANNLDSYFCFDHLWKSHREIKIELWVLYTGVFLLWWRPSKIDLMSFNARRAENNIIKVHDLVLTNRLLKVREIAETADISKDKTTFAHFGQEARVRPLHSRAWRCLRSIGRSFCVAVDVTWMPWNSVLFTWLTCSKKGESCLISWI